MNSPVEEIKSRLDIVEFISGYIRLNKAGMNYKALCPFHAEKTPSFFVSPSRQIWHCFGGCGKGGDVFRFVMEIEGLEFPEALKLLAQRAGVVLRREDPSLRSEKNRLYDICEEGAKIFEMNLSRTPAAKNYLSKRGVREETVKEFRIGFAPQSWDFLLKALRAKGFKNEELEKAGLIVKSEDRGSWYDRFRGRIMFPIRDTNGRVVGFGGRVLDENGEIGEVGQAKRFIKRSDSSTSSPPAKYINTPQTLIYDKSRVLYGFDRAKNEIRAKNQAVLVEGYMDCIMSHQAGVKNAVAVSGTALTLQQLIILRRIGENLVSAFDADAAGESATKRSLGLAAQFGFSRKIVPIAGKDPADMALESPEAWRKAVGEAKPVLEFYFEKAFGQNDVSSPEGKKMVSMVLLPLIAEIYDEIEKAHWVQEFSRRLGVGEESVWTELRKQKPDSSGPESSKPAQEERGDKTASSDLPTRRLILEERFLTLLPLVSAELKAGAFEKWTPIFASEEHQKIFEAIHGQVYGDEPRKFGVGPEIAGKIEILRFKGEVLGAINRGEFGAEFTACRRELEKECLKEELARLASRIGLLEKEGRQAEVLPILQNFRELSLRLKQL